MGTGREELLQRLWEAQDEAYDLMAEYDSLPHRYGDNVLYQAEGHIIDLIADHPGITLTELGAILHKTPSACSQIVQKLRKKGWVLQSRNQQNNRQYNLTLTESGQRVYADHTRFSQNCQDLTFGLLAEFTEEELEHHLRVQKKLNLAYMGDIQRSKEAAAQPAGVDEPEEMR